MSERESGENRRIDVEEFSAAPDSADVKGFAMRVLFRRGRRFDDYVLLQPDVENLDGLEAPPGGDFRVLSCSPIVPPSDRGPVLLVDRVLPARFEEPARWVKFATSDLIAGTYTEDPRRDPMPDDEFWPLIGLLDGQIDDLGLSRLIEALSELEYLQLVAFRDALWEKLHELDHPGNTVRLDDDPESPVGADASLYYRCEIVARGQDAFRSAVASPRLGVGEDGASGEGLLTVAEDATRFKLLPIDIEIETGTNTDHWPDAKPPRYPWLQLPSVGAFSDRITHYDRKSADEVLLRLSFTSFVGYATGADGHVRELMGCLMAGSFANARQEATDFLTSVLSPDETLDANLVVWQSGVARPMPGVSLTGFSRRRAMSMDEFIASYYTGESAAALSAGGGSRA